MDTSRQVMEGVVAKSEVVKPIQRQRRSIAEKRKIVEETLVEGASVSRVARSHGLNANQLFGWRRLYLSGRLGEQKRTMRLLPVRVTESVLPARSDLIEVSNAQSQSVAGAIHIDVRQGQVRIEGSVDPGLVRVLLECLGR